MGTARSVVPTSQIPSFSSSVSSRSAFEDAIAQMPEHFPVFGSHSAASVNRTHIHRAKQVSAARIRLSPRWRAVSRDRFSSPAAERHHVSGATAIRVFGWHIDSLSTMQDAPSTDSDSDASPHSIQAACSACYAAKESAISGGRRERQQVQVSADSCFVGMGVQSQFSDPRDSLVRLSSLY